MRSGHFHGVQFYNDPDALCRIVANFVGEGLEQGALAVIIATRDHAARVESCLRSRGIDVDAPKRQGNLAILDAGDTLHRFMADGMPDRSAFKRLVGSALADVRRGRGHCTMGLWRDGGSALERRPSKPQRFAWRLCGTSRRVPMISNCCADTRWGTFIKRRQSRKFTINTLIIARDGHATVLTDHHTASATRH